MLTNKRIYGLKQKCYVKTHERAITRGSERNERHRKCPIRVSKQVTKDIRNVTESTRECQAKKRGNERERERALSSVQFNIK